MIKINNRIMLKMNNNKNIKYVFKKNAQYYFKKGLSYENIPWIKPVSHVKTTQQINTDWFHLAREG